MDYKRAWLLIDSLNRAFRVPSVERSTGGAGGGGATLTAFGEKLLASYRQAEAEVAKIVAADVAFLERNAAPEMGEKI